MPREKRMTLLGWHGSPSDTIETFKSATNKNYFLYFILLLRYEKLLMGINIFKE